MAEAEGAMVVASNEEQKFQIPFINIFQNLRLNFPRLKPADSAKEIATTETISIDGEASLVTRAPDFNSVAYPKTRQSHALKLSVKESEQGSQNLWQVYAIGGFMMARWAWARWKEFKALNGGNNPPAEVEEPDNVDG